MPLILRAIWGQVSGPVALLLVLALGFQTVRLGEAHHARDKAQAGLMQASADLGTCRGNVSGLEAGVAAQNRAVDALKAEGDARVTASVNAARQARAVAESLRRDADRILAAPRGQGDACKLADDMILRELGLR